MQLSHLSNKAFLAQKGQDWPKAKQWAQEMLEILENPPPHSSPSDMNRKRANAHSILGQALLNGQPPDHLEAAKEFRHAFDLAIQLNDLEGEAQNGAQLDVSLAEIEGMEDMDDEMLPPPSGLTLEQINWALVAIESQIEATQRTIDQGGGSPSGNDDSFARLLEFERQRQVLLEAHKRLKR